MPMRWQTNGGCAKFREESPGKKRWHNFDFDPGHHCPIYLYKSSYCLPHLNTFSETSEQRCVGIWRGNWFFLQFFVKKKDARRFPWGHSVVERNLKLWNVRFSDMKFTQVLFVWKQTGMLIQVHARCQCLLKDGVTALCVPCVGPWRRQSVLCSFCGMSVLAVVVRFLRGFSAARLLPLGPESNPRRPLRGTKEDQ